MYAPHTYPVAILMMLVGMLCWRSRANTEKIDETWRFELYCWDYMWGLLACALLFGLTLGRTNPDFGKFLPQSRQRKRSLFGGGVRRRNDFQSREAVVGMRRLLLEHNLGGMLFLDRPSNSACLRVQFNVISRFEVFCHRLMPLFPERHPCKHKNGAIAPLRLVQPRLLIAL